MSERLEWVWVLTGLYPRQSFAQLPVTVAYCDFCETRRLGPNQDMCQECRTEFEVLAAKVRPYFGQPVTPGQLQSMGLGPRPSRFRYGKPWQEHLPPHERKRYGLHA